MSTFLQLAEKREKLVAELEQVDQDLLLHLKSNGSQPQAVSKPKANKQPRKPRTTANGEKKPSMKEIVQDILRQSSKGLSLNEIVQEVAKLIKDGKYTTKAESVSAVVSQALNQLTKDHVINREKQKSTTEGGEEKTSSVYLLVPVAA